MRKLNHTGKMQPYFNKILSDYRSQKAKRFLFSSLLLILFYDFIYSLILIIAESIWYFQPTTKTVLVLPFICNFVIIYIFIKFLKIRDINSKICNNELILEKIGNNFSDVKDKLINIFQLSYYDDELSKHAIRKFKEKYSVNKFLNRYSKTIPKSLQIKFIISFITLILSVIMFSNSFDRLINFRKKYLKPIPYYLNVVSGDRNIYAFDSLKIKVEHNIPDNFPLYLKKIISGNSEKIYPTVRNDSIANFQFNRIKDDFRYFVEVHRPNIFYPWKKFRSYTFEIAIDNRPEVRKLNFSIIPPLYSKLPNEFYNANIDMISALKGCQMSIFAELSDPIGKATFTTLDWQKNFKIDGKNAYLKFTMMNSGEYQFNFSNVDSIEINEPLIYKFKIISDEYPALQIFHPEQDIILTENFIIPFRVRISDDFGFNNFSISYKIKKSYSTNVDHSSKIYSIQIEKDISDQLIVDAWKIDEFLSPGDVIQYRFVVSDNDNISGPKIANSKVFTARFPTLNEMFERSHINENVIEQNIQKNYEKTKELAEKIEEIKMQLLKEGKIDWEDKSQLEEVLKEQKEINRKLDDIKKELEEHQKFLKENKLFDDKILDKYGKLQKIFDELMNDELFEMIKNMQQKINRNDDSNMEKMLQDFEDQQKRFEQALDRTLGIFEEIRKEQRLSEISKQLKESLKKQKKILEEEQNKSTEELATKEEKLSKDTKNIEEFVEKSKTEFDEEFNKILEELSEKLKQSKVSDIMQMSSEQYKNSKKSQGKKSAEKAKQELQKLSDSFEEQKNSYMQKKKNQIINDFQKIFIKTILASKEQEELNISVKQVSGNSPHLNIFSSKQYRVFERIKSINRSLIELSKKTFFIDKAIVQELRNAFYYTNEALKQIESGSIYSAKKPMIENLVTLNKLGYLLQKTMDSINSSKSGMGFGQYLKQLQNMAEKQKGLNSSMPQLGMSGNPSLMMNEMGKMAARQQAIRKSLKQLQQEMEGSGNNPLGNLEKIADDMEKVINEMRREKVNRQTIIRQRKILQRLLDASKSMRTRDKTRKRESKTGQQIDRESPFTLPENLGNKESIIRKIREQLKNIKIPIEDKKEMETYLELLRNVEE